MSDQNFVGPLSHLIALPSACLGVLCASCCRNQRKGCA